MARVAAMPKRGRPPGRHDFHPAVNGTLMEIPSELIWDSGGRRSAYDEVLNRLLEAPASQALRFEETRCRATIQARAKKMGMKICLAEWGGALWVKLLGMDGRKLRTSANAEESPRDAVRRCVREAPRTTAEIHDHLQQQFPGTMMPATSGLLESLRGKGEIAKRDDLKWYPVKK